MSGAVVVVILIALVAFSWVVSRMCEAKRDMDSHIRNWPSSKDGDR